TVGSGARLQTVGDMTLATASQDAVNTNAYVHTWGAVGVSDGHASASVSPTQRVTVDSGAQLTADGDINLWAGEDGGGHANSVQASANSRVYNYTAAPIHTAPGASASIANQNTVTVAGASGGQGRAQVSAGRDVSLVATRGYENAYGLSIGKNTYQKVVQDVGNAIIKVVNKVFHTHIKKVSLENRGGSSSRSGSSAVTVDGTVAAGADYHPHLTLSLDGSGHLVVDKTQGIDFSGPKQFDLKQSLTDELNTQQTLKTQYADNPQMVALIDGRISLLQHLLSQLKATGTQDVPLITLNDIIAQGGDVSVSGSLSGSGSLTAHGNPKVTVDNHTPDFLAVNNITIGKQGGNVTVNGARRNTGSAGGVSLSGVIPGSAPVVSISNTYDPNGQGMAPDLYLNGVINNPFGEVDVFNAYGNVRSGGKINAETVKITASQGDFIQTYTSGFTYVGGTPPQTKPQSAITAGGLVHVEAQYLDINGLIQSGIADATVTLDPKAVLANKKTLSKTIADARTAYRHAVHRYGADSVQARNARDVTLTGPTLLRPGIIGAHYRADTTEIVLDSEAIHGGTVYLYGNVFSTGHGKIHALSGYGHINVTNNTGIPLVVRQLSAGQGSDGQVRIVDTGKQGDQAANGSYYPLVTLYKEDWRSGVISMFNNTGAGNGDKPLTAAGTVSATATRYHPAEGAYGAWYIPRGTTYSGTAQVTDKDGHVHTVPVVGTSSPFGLYRPNESGFSVKPQTGLSAFLLNLFQAIYGSNASVPWTKLQAQGKALDAAQPIDIGFTGYPTGQVNIHSDAGVRIAGSISTITGTTTIDATGGALTQSDANGVLSARSLKLSADQGIGAAGAPVRVDLQGGTLDAESAHGGAVIDAPAGGLSLTAVNAPRGAVDLTADGDITGAGGTGVTVTGGSVNLTSLSGPRIGSARSCRHVAGNPARAVPRS
ncbi:MAG: hypothetical protein P8124_12035, partial [Gammaproteobacteria bacterium]